MQKKEGMWCGWWQGMEVGWFLLEGPFRRVPSIALHHDLSCSDLLCILATQAYGVFIVFLLLCEGVCMTLEPFSFLSTTPPRCSSFLLLQSIDTFSASPNKNKKNTHTYIKISRQNQGKDLYFGDTQLSFCKTIISIDRFLYSKMKAKEASTDCVCVIRSSYIYRPPARVSVRVNANRSSCCTRRQFTPPSAWCCHLSFSEQQKRLSHLHK